MEDNNKNDNKMKLFEQQVQKLEKSLELEVDKWNKIIKNLSNNTKGNIQKLPETESEILNTKQLIDADIRTYSLMMYKDVMSVKPLKKKRFEYYSTSYQIKMKNSTDIRSLIESDIAKIQYKIDLLDTHISFLRDTSSNLKTLGYSVKNRIELLNILGLD